MMDSPVPGEAKPNLAYNLHDRLVSKTIFINWLMIAIPVTFVIMIIVGLYVQSGWTCMVGMFGSIFCIFFVAMRLHYNQKNFTRKYRETVVLNLIKSTYPSVNYEPFSFFVPKVMWMSGLLEQVPNICRGDNYFSFSHSDYLAEFANEVCMRQTTRFRMSPKGIPRDSTTNDHLMNGLFYQFTFKSYFKTDIIILKDRARGIMGLFEENPDYLFNSFMHVEISDKEFEKEFEVYAKDPQAAKEMLNPEFIAMLKEIRNISVVKCRFHVWQINFTLP